MKKLLVALMVIVSLGTAGSVCAADFAKGWSAYKAGDYATALREWIPLAEQGNAFAQYNLGMIYGTVDAVKDHKKAFKWLKRSSKQGNAKAQGIMGEFYARGQNVPQDYKAAAEWYRRAAEQGHAPAQTSLAVMYGKGQGVRQNYKMAVKWYRRAAEQGYIPAQASLGVMYGSGQGVRQDNVYAHMWGNIAASSGNVGGRSLLDLLVNQMTPDQIVLAKQIAQRCVEKKFKGC